MLTLNGYEIEKKYFPDGTFNLTKLPEEAMTAIIEQGSAIIKWQFEEVAEQVLLYNLVCHLRYDLGKEDIILFMPYLPNARMDRVHDEVMEVHTLKHFARFINSLNFSMVFILDPHSDVGPALFDRLSVTRPFEVVSGIISGLQPDYLFFPDEGAAKRYMGAFPNIKYLYGEKVRDWETGKIQSLRLCNPFDISPAQMDGASVLIVDDICSYGGTFLRAGNLLKNAGFAEITLYVTHCEKSIFAGNLLKENSPIDHIFTTDSLIVPAHDKITILPLTTLDEEV